MFVVFLYTFICISLRELHTCLTKKYPFFDTAGENGFNPVWDELCEFDIINPQLALIRIIVQDEDMFGDPNFLGQATFPVTNIKTGENHLKFKLHANMTLRGINSILSSIGN